MRARDEPADYSRWLAAIFGVLRGFRKICPHSWDAFVFPTNMPGMWPRIGRKGPGVECKVHADVNST